MIVNALDVHLNLGKINHRNGLHMMDAFFGSLDTSISVED